MQAVLARAIALQETAAPQRIIPVTGSIVNHFAVIVYPIVWT